KINTPVLRIRSRWRPVLSLPLLVIMRRLGYASVHRAGGVYIVETRLPSRGGLTSLWCILTQVENIVKTGVKLVFPLLLGRTVICDRYALDMVVDGMAGLHDVPGRTRLGFQLLRLLPKPNFAFFMDIDPEVAFKRKPDLLRLEDYVERLQLYRELSSSWDVTIVNARVYADTIHRKAWKFIASSSLLGELVGDYEEQFRQRYDDYKVEPPSVPDVDEISHERGRVLGGQFDCSVRLQLFD